MGAETNQGRNTILLKLFPLIKLTGMKVYPYTLQAFKQSLYIVRADNL